MRNVKINGRVAEDGSIILPPGVLESMCLNPGNLVTLEFAPTSPVKEANGYLSLFQSEELAQGQQEGESQGMGVQTGKLPGNILT